MMKSKVTILILLLAFGNLYTQENKMSLINDIIKKVKSTYAPDKRTAVFEITATDSGGVYVLSGETNLTEAKNELIDNLNKLNISFEDKINLLPSKLLGENTYGIINLSVANIRTAPSHSAELATQALLGTPVKILKKDDGFYLVQTPDYYISWIDDGGLILMNKKEINEWIEQPKIIFTSEFGFAYKEPNVNSEHVSDLVAGNILINLGEKDDFYYVEFPDHRTAYIEKEKCFPLDDWLSKAEPTEANIISTAKRFLGIPYLWGGTSAKGMDCSGFTKTVYFLNGVVLQRDASQQVNTGTLVDTENGFENLRPGDLLFFGEKEKGDKKEKVTHVAIYIGNYEYIHASGRVMINSFEKDSANFSSYRLNHFIRAKRIINSLDKNGVITVKNNKFYQGDF
ncbi:NlpC/P60 family protein [Melioribacteraceae bacterium 4301-Me]|uniref:C40 family peptidase n=1 Tax=Pyranulibacter aquaticus TaxID=3163344 RepID=UPI0035973C85